MGKHLRLKFTVHAQERIQEREIEVDHIRQAINSPDFTEDAFQGKVKARKAIDESREIEVVYYKSSFRDTNDIVIITAYYLNN